MTKAIVLAAGRANRLLPLTANRPKGLLLAGGKPILQHIVVALKRHGIEAITIVIGHHGERIQAFFKDGSDFGVKIDYAHQAKPTGTMDAVLRGLAVCGADEPVLVVPGSLYMTDGTLAPLLEAGRTALLVGLAKHKHAQPIPTVAHDRLRSVNVEPPVLGSTRVSLGAALIDPTGIKALGQGNTIEEALAAVDNVALVEPAGPWDAVIDPWDLLQLNEHVLDQIESGPAPDVADADGAIQIGENCDISPTASIHGPVTIGSGCTIGDRTVIGPYVSIRNNSIIGTHCEVRRSIINNNVTVDSRSVLRGSILDDGVTVGAGFLGPDGPVGDEVAGCIIGADASLATGTVAKPGQIIDAATMVDDA